MRGFPNSVFLFDYPAIGSSASSARGQATWNATFSSRQPSVLRPSYSFAFILLFSGSTIMAPICRIDFYTIPFCAGLFCASIGLWLWQGALRVADPALGVTRRGRARTRVWTATDEKCDPVTIRVSLPRLAFGSLFMAATPGCRPPLIALCVMLVPMIVTICRQLSRGRKGTRHIARAAAWCAAPVALVFAGLGYWNSVRFGSPLNFGNDYQLTVVDLQNCREPLNVLVFISFKGGLLWRYKIDFALYMAVIAMYALLILMKWVDAHRDSCGGRAVSLTVLILTFAAGILCIQCVFVTNVSYPSSTTNRASSTTSATGSSCSSAPLRVHASELTA